MKKNKIILGLSFLLLFTSIFPYYFSARPAHANGEPLYVNAEILYLREGPGLSYPILDTLKEGTEIISIEKQGDWHHVQVGQQEGWVASWLVKTASGQSDSSTEKTVISQVNSLNVRVAPSLSASALTKISSGTESKFLKQDQDWIQIQFGEITGWVFAEYVTVKEAKTEAPAAPSDNGQQEQSNEPIQQIDPNTFTINVNAVNIRKKPDLTAKKLGLATEGQQFKVVSRDHNWVEIEYEKGKKGWIYSFYGTFTKQLKQNPSSEKEDTKNFVTIIYNGTNLRESPSTSSNVVVIADAGHTYPIVESEGDWFKIAVNDRQTAYVANWVVSENNSQRTTSKNQTNEAAERKKGTLKGLTIVLDAGHGGNDRGTTGVRGTDEKDINIITAEMLRSKLQAAGADVIMTRESDIFVDLRKRVAVSHQAGADAFISIHYDANEDSSVSGFTTYYTNGYQQKLAEYVHEGLASKVNLKDRGPRFGNYLVLRENRQNAILLELGYLSNPSEERAITTDYYREQATLGIYQGLLNYFDDQLEQ
ncbi:N-acetylmuramoyl-L-alanine amidase [Solibacillus sp. FSL W7-1436]|uniref:N-acetylmuramoyl-L-alanine amidase n=1 Tax=Solibacillus sp. FSL W7-1436 TaxID=2921705 RepID=UPI0030F9CF6F